MVTDGLKLNIRADAALRGGSLDWRADLAALLKSDAPIERWVRDALADAIMNQAATGPRLDLRNLKPASDHFDKVASRYEWMAIGRWIEARHAEGMTIEGATYLAVESFTDPEGKPVSEGKCKRALTYYQHANRWVEQGLSTPSGETLGREMLERFHHEIDANPADRTFAQANAELLRALNIPH